MVAGDLIHLPDKPAGPGPSRCDWSLATDTAIRDKCWVQVLGDGVVPATGPPRSFLATLPQSREGDIHYHCSLESGNARHNRPNGNETCAIPTSLQPQVFDSPGQAWAVKKLVLT